MGLRRLSCLALSVALVLPLFSAGQVLAADSTRSAELQRKKEARKQRKAQIAERRAALEAARARRRAVLEAEKAERRALIEAKRAEHRALIAAKVKLRKDARDFRHLQVPGTEVAEGTRRLVETLTWHRDLEVAKEDARALGKPILWIQALGELDGFL